MRFSHTQTPHWGRLNKLHFWRWGITIDIGTHRWIWTLIEDGKEWYE